MKYKVVKAYDNIDLLSEYVNNSLKDGWKPIGGVAATVAPVNGRVIFYQAMIKEEE